MKIHTKMYGLLLASLLTARTPMHGLYGQTQWAKLTASDTRNPTAAEVLRQAAENFTKTRTMQFSLASTQVPPGLHLAGVDQGTGTAIWPDQLVFNGSIKQSPALSMGFVMVMCGPDQYIEMGDGNFQKLPGAPNVGRLLFAHDTSFISNVITQLKQPTAPQAVTLDQAPMWHLKGSVPRTALTLVAGPATSALGPIQAELWVGQRDMRLHQLTLTGTMFEGDSAQTTRTFTFSHFNETATLTVPRGTLPCGAKR